MGSPDPIKNLGSRKATEVVELSVLSIETSPCLNVGALIYIYIYVYIYIYILYSILYIYTPATCDLNLGNLSRVVMELSMGICPYFMASFGGK